MASSPVMFYVLLSSSRQALLEDLEEDSFSEALAP
jgi:hypothetical protein